MSLLFLLDKRKIKEARRSEPAKKKKNRAKERFKEGRNERERMGDLFLDVSCFRSCKTQIKTN